MLLCGTCSQLNTATCLNLNMNPSTSKVSATCCDYDANSLKWPIALLFEKVTSPPIL